MSSIPRLPIPLPGTRDEILLIQDLTRSVMNWEADLVSLTGSDASENQVRSHLPGKRYVHIGTHGFFEPEQLPSLRAEAIAAGAETQGGFNQQLDAVDRMPGLLSGLVLAGANAERKLGSEDGYLTAEEISYLDLTHCDLAVLSACESALGSSRSGEGLISLRRALRIAGARSVISTLWKVGDPQTSRLVRDFYFNYWSRGMGKLEALHQAKLFMLRRNRLEFQGDARPVDWGALILSGDWR